MPMIFSSIRKLFKRIKQSRAEPPKRVPFYEREIPRYSVREHGSPGNWLVEINYPSFQFAFQETAPTAAIAVKQAIDNLSKEIDRWKESDHGH